ncbi:hypothetical protein [Actinomadura harenae]|uniref:Uncharacterized protein n=1 Tax=Actinomadura harenae TaxID=2483351 RepID=A0A3M2LEZ8_9ACTN|nr:hypothetical protein [Actinomadura harenae]RMI34555.1 hypothetical protein EBO15_40855 [Actinomadura harenae]
MGTPIDWAPPLAGRAIAIMCMPCQFDRGYFVPTSSLVLADLSGSQQPHPVLELARALATPTVPMPPEAKTILVIFDDLDPARNWMLPPGTDGAAAVREAWPAARAAAVEALAVAPLPVEVVALSEFLASDRERYEQLLNEYAERLARCLDDPGGATAARQVMRRQMQRRARWGSSRVDVDDARQRAARCVANYAVQGDLVVAGRAAGYLSWSEEEIPTMAVFDPRIADVVVDLPSPIPASGSRALVDEALPPGPRWAELRETLPLYLDDLPRTPGAVAPGLAADAVAAVGKILTPGLVEVGEAEVTALNAILPGGPTNRARVRELLDGLLGLLRQGPDPGRVWLVDEFARKITAHLIARYDDEDIEVEHARHRLIVDALVEAFPADQQVALVLSGSLVSAPAGVWHPYLSDIDVMPVRIQTPTSDEVTALQDVYDRVGRPDWLYLNMGSCIGVGGVTEEPRSRLFVVERAADLTAAERVLITHLARQTRLIAGPPTIWQAFCEVHGLAA